jgi:two-component system, OmpR family, response regulator MtrA
MAGTALIVEDDAAIGTVLRMLLEDEGLHVELAQTGHQALALARARPPVLAIVDLGLPGLYGSSVTTALRWQQRDLPVILVSALPKATLAQAASDCQAAAYLSKPFERDDRVGLVRKVRAQAGSEQAA